uniref:Uncharacterized protein n=1 Tax=Steinernema glaseri TaxID=37863 RepID=A0A1I8AKR2_9BILA
MLSTSCRGAPDLTSLSPLSRFPCETLKLWQHLAKEFCLSLTEPFYSMILSSSFPSADYAGQGELYFNCGLLLEHLQLNAWRSPTSSRPSSLKQLGFLSTHQILHPYLRSLDLVVDFDTMAISFVGKEILFVPLMSPSSQTSQPFLYLDFILMLLPLRLSQPRRALLQLWPSF